MYDQCMFDVTSEKYRDHHFLDEHGSVLKQLASWHAPDPLLSCTPLPCQRCHCEMLPAHSNTKSLNSMVPSQRYKRGSVIVMLQADSTGTALQIKKAGYPCSWVRWTEFVSMWYVCLSNPYMWSPSIYYRFIHSSPYNKPLFQKTVFMFIVHLVTVEAWLTVYGLKLYGLCFIYTPDRGLVSLFLLQSFSLFTVHFTLLFSWGTIIWSPVLYIHPCLTVPTNYLSLFTLHFIFLWKRFI